VTPAIADAALWDGELLGLELAGERVVLVRIDGVAHAYVDRCAHLGVRLSEGKLVGRTLTCAAHHYTYDACTGCGINPASAKLRRLPIEIQDGVIHVEVTDTRVGPVLEASAIGHAIVAAIRADNVDAAIEVVDRGAYLRVLVADRCHVTRAAIEQALGRAFRLPGDLELCMSSWRGAIAITADDVAWEAK
jgi:nitrite reductase/ring-hydroxylating ferredoxin subunit